MFQYLKEYQSKNIPFIKRSLHQIRQKNQNKKNKKSSKNKKSFPESIKYKKILSLKIQTIRSIKLNLKKKFQSIQKS